MVAGVVGCVGCTLKWPARGVSRRGVPPVPVGPECAL